MNQSLAILPHTDDTGTLGVKHLHRYWAKCMAKRNGLLPMDSFPDEWNQDRALLNMLGLGLEQTIRFVFQEAPSFEAFETWVLQCNNGDVDPERIRLYHALTGTDLSVSEDPVPAPESLLSPAQLQCWQENGYLILPAVISKEDCEQTVQLICDTIEIDQHDPSTWYHGHTLRQGIMVQLFQHPLLEKNRQNRYIRQVYESLWGRRDLIVSTDRVGFNPPETERWKFPGPGMHWDVSLKTPIPFGLQGILYLADTAENQGAFSLVPGFHHRIENWLQELPKEIHPRTVNIYELGVKPIAAQAGDFIIWHHALPHGSSPNTATRPRYVHYINWAPAREEYQQEWI